MSEEFGEAIFYAFWGEEEDGGKDDAEHEEAREKRDERGAEGKGAEHMV